MDNNQLTHLQNLVDETSVRMSEKYSKGAKEHKSNLWDQSVELLLENAIDEAVDQLTYLLTLKQKINGKD